MTKTQRASSYLRHIARRYDSHMPLLKPPRMLAWHWGTTLPYDRAAETTLPTQQSSVKTGTIPLLQASTALSPQHVAELPSTHPTKKTVLPARAQEETPPPSALGQGQATAPTRLRAPITVPDGSTVTEETASEVWEQPPQIEIQPAPTKSVHRSSSPVTTELPPAHPTKTPALSAGGQEEISPPSAIPKPSELHAPVAVPDGSPVTEETVSEIRKQPPQIEIQLAPAKSVHSVVAETSRPSNVMPVSSDRQTRASSKEKPVSVTLRPQPLQQQEATPITQTNSRRTVNFLGQESKAGTRLPEPLLQTPSVSPRKQEAQQQRAAIHIGTIEVHIVPPALPVPLPPVQRATARPRSTSALSREMTSVIGLRQG